MDQSSANRISGPVCLHCQCAPATRSRGLCGFCYFAPGVREQYPLADSPYSRRGAGRKGRKRRPRPTEYLPGTPGKVAVLEQRARDGELLFHPDDPTVFPPSFDGAGAFCAPRGAY